MLKVPKEYRRYFDAGFIKKIVLTSREKLGFFTAHLPRLFEYPWILDRVIREGGETVIDFGAGVSPIPLLLAQAGKRVVTVDNSPLRRTPMQKGDINEWGYLDYSQFDASIKSYNCNFEDIDFTEVTVNCVYSISVIEHIPADVRRKLLVNITAAIANNGCLILTL